MEKREVFSKIHAMARCIPPGRVATYGQLARVCGFGRGARMAGWAMMAVPEGSDIPAHRVVHADGTLCVGSNWEATQRSLLTGEGVPFTASGRVDLPACRLEDGELALLWGEGVL